MEILILGRKQKTLPPDKVFQGACACVLKGEGYSKGGINIILMSDREIHGINKAYLDHDEPTDVITFPLTRESGVMTGELYLGVGVARRSAKALGHSLEEELVLYTIHGALHLCGYDDLKPRLRKKMRSKEKFYLEKLGYPDISPRE